MTIYGLSEVGISDALSHYEDLVHQRMILDRDIDQNTRMYLFLSAERLRTVILHQGWTTSLVQELVLLFQRMSDDMDARSHQYQDLAREESLLLDWMNGEMDQITACIPPQCENGDWTYAHSRSARVGSPQVDEVASVLTRELDALHQEHPLETVHAVLIPCGGGESIIVAWDGDGSLFSITDTQTCRSETSGSLDGAAVIVSRFLGWVASL